MKERDLICGIAVITVATFGILIFLGLRHRTPDAGESAPAVTPRAEQTPESAPAIAPPPEQTPEYNVVSTEDVSYANVVRKTYRVRVPRKMTEQELTIISESIVSDATSRQKINEITIWFYLPESSTKGVFTAGMATWAPGGIWGGEPSLPPRLVVMVSKLGLSQENIANLPLSTKQQIFTQIILLQDRGVGDDLRFTRSLACKVVKSFSVPERVAVVK